MKSTKCPAKEKKRGEKKAKSKSQDGCVTFKPPNFAFCAYPNFTS